MEEGLERGYPSFKYYRDNPFRQKRQMNEKEGTMKEIDKNAKLKGLTKFFFSLFTSFIQELCV